jgi:putative SOS response-associated peptidase YedK
MCNEYLRTKGISQLEVELSEVKIPLRFPPPERRPNLPPQPRVRPTDQAVILRGCEDGVELAMARWWFVPSWHKGKLRDFKANTFNTRSETVATLRTFRDAFARRRCLIVADGWYEFTGNTRKDRARWRVMPRHENGVCFAGIWDRCETTDEGMVDSFTMLMRDAAPPLDGLHTRQPVILRREDWATWLGLSADVEPLYRLDNADRFGIEKWDASSASLL